jgi:hypothetical protein
LQIIFVVTCCTPNCAKYLDVIKGVGDGEW